MRKFASSIVQPFVRSPRTILYEQYAYGHLEIYLRFFDLRPNSYLLAELQHGWALDRTWLHQNKPILRARNKRLRQYPLLLWSGSLADGFRNDGQSNVFAIASPWRVLVEAFASKVKSGDLVDYVEKKDSILYFPSHSFPGIDGDALNPELRDIIESSGFKSVTTCLYWTDFLDPRTRAFYEMVSEVTCLGFRSPSANEAPWHDIGGRVNFLYKLHKLLSESELIVCDEISTAAMAALVLGKRVFICRDFVKYSNVGRSETLVMNSMDNIKIMSSINSKNARTPLGLEISNSNELIQRAFEGFGFDLSMTETRGLVKSVLSTVDLFEKESNQSKPSWLKSEW